MTARKRQTLILCSVTFWASAAILLLLAMAEINEGCGKLRRKRRRMRMRTRTRKPRMRRRKNWTCADHRGRRWCTARKRAEAKAPRKGIAEIVLLGVLVVT